MQAKAKRCKQPEKNFSTLYYSLNINIQNKERRLKATIEKDQTTCKVKPINRNSKTKAGTE
jgi:hypothetical protein